MCHSTTLPPIARGDTHSLLNVTVVSWHIHLCVSFSATKIFIFIFTNKMSTWHTLEGRTNSAAVTVPRGSAPTIIKQANLGFIEHDSQVFWLSSKIKINRQFNLRDHLPSCHSKLVSDLISCAKHKQILENVLKRTTSGPLNFHYTDITTKTFFKISFFLIHRRNSHVFEPHEGE